MHTTDNKQVSYNPAAFHCFPEPLSFHFGLIVNGSVLENQSYNICKEINFKES